MIVAVILVILIIVIVAISGIVSDHRREMYDYDRHMSFGSTHMTYVRQELTEWLSENGDWYSTYTLNGKQFNNVRCRVKTFTKSAHYSLHGRPTWIEDGYWNPKDTKVLSSSNVKFNKHKFIVRKYHDPVSYRHVQLMICELMELNWDREKIYHIYGIDDEFPEWKNAYTTLYLMKYSKYHNKWIRKDAKMTEDLLNGEWSSGKTPRGGRYKFTETILLQGEENGN